MDFNEYLQVALEEDSELKKAFDALQPQYEIMEALVRARMEANLTQKDLAKKCGIKQGNISRLESGKGNPTIKLLQKVADSLDCDLVLEFRKRETVTETYMETTKNAVTTVRLGNVMKGFDRVGSTQRAVAYTVAHNMTLRTI